MHHHNLTREDRKHTLFVWRYDLTQFQECRVVDVLRDIFGRSTLEEPGLGYAQHGEFVFAKSPDLPETKTIFFRIRFRKDSPLRPTTDYFYLTITDGKWFVDQTPVEPVDLELSRACVQAIVLDDRVWGEKDRARFIAWTSAAFP